VTVVYDGRGMLTIADRASLNGTTVISEKIRPPAAGVKDNGYDAVGKVKHILKKYPELWTVPSKK
jgi:hypothetical protein